MTDIVERLRELGSASLRHSPAAVIFWEAADEIERLRARAAAAEVGRPAEFPSPH